MTAAEPEALIAELLDRYRAFDRPAPPERPWVTANMVVSVDGRTTLDGRVRELGSGPDKAVFAAIRAHGDAVLVGAGTVRAEGYGPVRVSPEQAEARARSGRGAAAPPLVILTSTAALDWEARYVTATETPTIVVVPGERVAEVPAEAPVEVLGAPQTPVDLRWLLARLGQRGVRHVVAEGGPTLLARLLDAGLVDELCLTVAPMLTGRAGGDLGLVRSLEGTRSLELVACTAIEGDAFLRYRVGPLSG